MAFDKITNTDITQNYVQGAPDFPSGTPQQKKQIFDKLPLKIIERINALITKLENSNEGGGSANIGSPSIAGVDGTTVLAQLQSLKEQLTEVVVGTIPDGTLTKDKFEDFDSDVMEAELVGYYEAENAADLNETDSVVVAFGKLQKTISDLTDALQNYKDDISDGTIVVNKAATASDQLQSDSSDKIANTKYVRQAISDVRNINIGGITSAVGNVAINTGEIKRQVNFVVLPELNFTITAITSNQAYNTTKIAQTPSGFVPKEMFGVSVSGTAGVMFVRFVTNGDIELTCQLPSTAEGKTVSVSLKNLGWEIT